VHPRFCPEFPVVLRRRGGADRQTAERHQRCYGLRNLRYEHRPDGEPPTPLFVLSVPSISSRDFGKEGPTAEEACTFPTAEKTPSHPFLPKDRLLFSPSRVLDGEARFIKTQQGRHQEDCCSVVKEREPPRGTRTSPSSSAVCQGRLSFLATPTDRPRRTQTQTL
jgi:hypothetical protein